MSSVTREWLFNIKVDARDAQTTIDNLIASVQRLKQEMANMTWNMPGAGGFGAAPGGVPTPPPSGGGRGGGGAAFTGTFTDPGWENFARQAAEANVYYKNKIRELEGLIADVKLNQARLVGLNSQLQDLIDNPPVPPGGQTPTVRPTGRSVFKKTTPPPNPNIGYSENRLGSGYESDFDAEVMYSPNYRVRPYKGVSANQAKAILYQNEMSGKPPSLDEIAQINSALKIYPSALKETFSGLNVPTPGVQVTDTLGSAYSKSSNTIFFNRSDLENPLEYGQTARHEYTHAIIGQLSQRGLLDNYSPKVYFQHALAAGAGDLPKKNEDLAMMLTQFNEVADIWARKIRAAGELYEGYRNGLGDPLTDRTISAKVAETQRYLQYVKSALTRPQLLNAFGGADESLFRSPGDTMRLYRGEAVPGSGQVAPDWVTQSPEYAGIRAATGRWWTDKPEIADWYKQDAIENGMAGRIVYQDVPKHIADANRVDRLGPEIQRFSRDPQNEYFLPSEYVGRGQLLSEDDGLKHSFRRNPVIEQFTQEIEQATIATRAFAASLQQPVSLRPGLQGAINPNLPMRYTRTGNPMIDQFAGEIQSNLSTYANRGLIPYVDPTAFSANIPPINHGPSGTIYGPGRFGFPPNLPPPGGTYFYGAGGFSGGGFGGGGLPPAGGSTYPLGLPPPGGTGGPGLIPAATWRWAPPRPARGRIGRARGGGYSFGRHLFNITSAVAIYRTYEFFVQSIEKSVTLMADLERVAARVGFVLGENTNQAKSFVQQVQNVGVSYGIAPSQQGDAAIRIAQATKNTDEQRTLAVQAAQLAALSGQGYGQSVDDLTRIQQAFNLTISDTPRILGAISQVYKSVPSDIAEITNQMERLGAVAEITGLSMEQISIIAAKTAQQSNANLSTTATTFTRVQENLGQVPTQRLLEQYGIIPTDAQGQVRPFIALLTEVHQKIEELRAQGRGTEADAIAKAIAGRPESVRVFLSMLDNLDAKVKVTIGIEDLWANQSITLDQKLKNLTATWEQFLLKLGNTAPIKSVVDYLQKLVDNANRLLGMGSGVDEQGNPKTAGQLGADVRNDKDRNAALMQFITNQAGDLAGALFSLTAIGQASTAATGQGFNNPLDMLGRIIGRSQEFTTGFTTGNAPFASQPEGLKEGGHYVTASQANILQAQADAKAAADKVEEKPLSTSDQRLIREGILQATRLQAVNRNAITQEQLNEIIKKSIDRAAEEEQLWKALLTSMGIVGAEQDKYLQTLRDQIKGAAVEFNVGGKTQLVTGAGAAYAQQFAPPDVQTQFMRLGIAPGQYGQFEALMKKYHRMLEEAGFKEDAVPTVFGVGKDRIQEIMAQQLIYQQAAALALDEMLKLEKGALNGVYNLPEGASAYVAFGGFQLDRATRASMGAGGTAKLDTGPFAPATDKFSGAVNTFADAVAKDVADAKKYGEKPYPAGFEVKPPTLYGGEPGYPAGFESKPPTLYHGEEAYPAGFEQSAAQKIATALAIAAGNVPAGGGNFYDWNRKYFGAQQMPAYGENNEGVSAAKFDGAASVINAAAGLLSTAGNTYTNAASLFMSAVSAFSREASATPKASPAPREGGDVPKAPSNPLSPWLNREGATGKFREGATDGAVKSSVDSLQAAVSSLPPQIASSMSSTPLSVTVMNQAQPVPVIITNNNMTSLILDGQIIANAMTSIVTNNLINLFRSTPGGGTSIP